MSDTNDPNNLEINPKNTVESGDQHNSSSKSSLMQDWWGSSVMMQRQAGRAGQLIKVSFSCHQGPTVVRSSGLLWYNRIVVLYGTDSWHTGRTMNIVHICSTSKVWNYDLAEYENTNTEGGNRKYWHRRTEWATWVQCHVTWLTKWSRDTNTHRERNSSIKGQHIFPKNWNERRCSQSKSEVFVILESSSSFFVYNPRILKSATFYNIFSQYSNIKIYTAGVQTQYQLRVESVWWLWSPL